MKRFFQDERFEVVHASGATVLECLAICAGADELEPALLVLKPRGFTWQRFHLDAVGFAVWEEAPDEVVKNDLGDDAYMVVDYAARFGLRESQIRHVRCAPDDDGRVHLQIEFSVGVLTLSLTDEGTSAVSFVPADG